MYSTIQKNRYFGKKVQNERIFWIAFMAKFPKSVLFVKESMGFFLVTEILILKNEFGGMKIYREIKKLTSFSNNRIVTC